MYPFLLFIFEKTNLYHYLWKKDSKEILMAVYLHKEEKNTILLYWCRRCSITMVVFLLGVVFAFMAGIKDMESKHLKQGYIIERNEWGDGEKTIDLQTEVKEGDKIYKENIETVIGERKYNEKEREEKFKETKEYIDKSVLGKNRSVEDIRFSLNLMKNLPGSAIKIEWTSQDDSIIDTKGSVHNEGIAEDGKLLMVKALIKYGEIKEEYPIFLRVNPPIYTKEQQLRNELVEAIKKIVEENPTEQEIKLPTTVKEKEVNYAEEGKGSSGKIILYTILAAAVVYILIDKELRNLYKKRERELQLDYPEIINKFVLLLGAGMTTKGAWEKISLEYRKKRQDKKDTVRYAYEEMLITYYQICNGVPETKAYENFGRRLKALPYLKFSSLITQNLKKGSKGLLELLEYEAIEAFNERKELAKKMGEEASTKLLGPMVAMLLIVMGIIIFPAFMTL